MIPAIGPTAPWWWQGSSAISPRGREQRSLLRRRGPALVGDRAGDRALHRTAHVLPRDRRAGVQDAPLAVERRDRVAGEQDVDEHGLRREVARERGRVGLLDPRIAEQPGEPHAGAGVAAGRRAPGELDGAAARRADVVGEVRQADVGDVQLLREQIAHATAPRARRARSRRTPPTTAASAFVSATSAPHARSCVDDARAALRVGGRPADVDDRRERRPPSRVGPRVEAPRRARTPGPSSSRSRARHRRAGPPSSGRRPPARAARRAGRGRSSGAGGPA